MSKQKEDKTSETPIIKKRGRKPKKDTEQNAVKEKDNISVVYEEANTEEENIDITNVIDSTNQLLSPNIDIANIDEPAKHSGKKRGRKPKGGKIIPQMIAMNNLKESKPNVILHLKCSLKDLNSNILLNPNIESFNFNGNKNDNSYEVIGLSDNNYNTHLNSENTEMNSYVNDEMDYDDDIINKNRDNDNKEVWKKLKTLEHKLHINNISDKKSACFWCTYDFDNPPVYIPKYYIKDSYQVYGCFCSPECATAYLMEENIDSSSKFERYHLINHIYTKIYDYNKNIKPAPNPYYMLEKYYGNLTIQEYRSLLKNERLFLVVDKPLTRILPELHEDNDDFIINNKIIPSNTYQIKKKLHKKQLTKKNILNEKFGLIQQ